MNESPGPSFSGRSPAGCGLRVCGTACAVSSTLGAAHPFSGPLPATAAKPCAMLVLGYALHGIQPFLALVGLRPPLVAGFGFAVPLARCPQPSVLRTLLAARSPAGCGLRTAVALRAVLALGASAPFLAARSPAYGGQALRYACAWLRASWLSAISGASRPSASLGRGLRVCGTAARCPQPSVLRTL